MDHEVDGEVGLIDYPLICDHNGECEKQGTCLMPNSYVRTRLFEVASKPLVRPRLSRRTRTIAHEWLKKIRQTLKESE